MLQLDDTQWCEIQHRSGEFRKLLPLDRAAKFWVTGRQTKTFMLTTLKDWTTLKSRTEYGWPCWCGNRGAPEMTRKRDALGKFQFFELLKMWYLLWDIRQLVCLSICNTWQTSIVWETTRTELWDWLGWKILMEARWGCCQKNRHMSGKTDSLFLWGFHSGHFSADPCTNDSDYATQRTKQHAQPCHGHQLSWKDR